MEATMAIFVAMAPAIAFALVGFFIEVVPVFLKWLRSAVLQYESTTSWLIDLLHSATLIGTSVASFLGLKDGSSGSLFLGLVWAVLCGTVSYKLARWLEVLRVRNAEGDLKLRHRKMAGTVRSIVRDELRVVTRDEGDSSGA